MDDSRTCQQRRPVHTPFRGYRGVFSRARGPVLAADAITLSLFSCLIAVANDRKWNHPLKTNNASHRIITAVDLVSLPGVEAHYENPQHTLSQCVSRRSPTNECTRAESLALRPSRGCVAEMKRSVRLNPVTWTSGTVRDSHYLFQCIHLL